MIELLIVTAKPVTYITAFIVLDILSGIINSFVHRRVSSEIAFSGFVKHLFVIMVVAIGSGYSFISDTKIISDLVLGYYSFMYFVSVLENAHEIGVPLPDKLSQFLNRKE